MAKKFKKGALITNPIELIAWDLAGSGFVYYKGRPISNKFVGHMNLMTVVSGIQNKLFYKAIRKDAV